MGVRQTKNTQPKSKNKKRTHTNTRYDNERKREWGGTRAGEVGEGVSQMARRDVEGSENHTNEDGPIRKWGDETTKTTPNERDRERNESTNDKNEYITS